jgi:CRISPR system Cascade subunit CasD
MAIFVVFRLEAPIASFGDIAPGERRVSADRPSHSAIAGMVAGALGLSREDPASEKVAEMFLMAVRADCLGQPFADFHTVQAPARQRGKTYATRRVELADKDKLGTVVSRRDYWTDVAFTVALYLKGSSVGADTVVLALNSPKFSPFAGRRSCPLGAPVAARAIIADTVKDAFESYDTELNAFLTAAGLPQSSAGQIVSYSVELHEDLLVGISRLRVEERRDFPLSRNGNRTFLPRKEGIGRLAGKCEET